MSAQIRIERNGSVSFKAPDGVQQTDMVFWHNYDSEPHFPIPGAGALKVESGQTTAAFRPAPQPTFPTTITYACALHSDESGTLVVNADTPPSNPTGTNGTAASLVIAIRAGGIFEEANVWQPDTVVWKNEDSQAHWPVPNCTGLLVKPDASSNALQPAPNPIVPLTILYGCAIPGHEAEQGTINIWNSFVAVTTPIALSATAPSAPIATGGKSPYTFRPDPAYAQTLVL
ncbi:MAG TPA: hypothetical protein VN605_12490, partial [Thermoanaerobaculia bacterium]|nr:hypothetical protein [Thermoanaerobaculia bacterium]